ncbi:MAG: hypothetical protein K2M82_06525 [Lachnospiraceae bacterium]|nr:hypothetical protein [Lachnospiraceae bacterium]
MDFSSMTSEEVFSWLVDTINNGGEITLEMLNEILASRSIIDPVASENAVTIFYNRKRTVYEKLDG